MPYFTDEDLAEIKKFTPKIDPPVATNPQGLFGRSVDQGKNLLSNTANSLIGDFYGLANLIAPDPYYTTGRLNGKATTGPINPEVSRVFSPVVDIPEPTSFGEQAVDYIGGGLAPEIAAFLIPYTAAGKVAKTAKLTGAGIEAAALSSANALSAADQGPGQMLLQASVGAVGGAATKFARLSVPRIGMVAAAGTGQFIGQEQLGGDLTQSSVQSLADIVSNMLPGRVGGKVPSVSIPEPKPRLQKKQTSFAQAVEIETTNLDPIPEPKPSFTQTLEDLETEPFNLDLDPANVTPTDVTPTAAPEPIVSPANEPLKANFRNRADKEVVAIAGGVDGNPVNSIPTHIDALALARERKTGFTNIAMEIAETIKTPAQLEHLKRMADGAKREADFVLQQAREEKISGDDAAMRLQDAGVQSQYYREIYEAATKTGGFTPTAQKALNSLSVSNGGFVINHTASSLTGAAIGGSAGYISSEGDPGVTLGAAALGFGVSAFALKHLDDITKQIGQSKSATKAAFAKSFKGPKQATPKAAIVEGFKDLRQAAANAAADATHGRGGVIGQTFRAAEHLLQIGQDSNLKANMNTAQGITNDLVLRAKEILDDTAHLKPSDQMSQASALYMHGQIIPRSILEPVLQALGAVDETAYNLMSSSQKAKLRKYNNIWAVKDDPWNTNKESNINPATGKPDIVYYLITPEIRKEIVKRELDHLMSARSADEAFTQIDDAFAELPIKIRELRNETGLRIAQGLPRIQALAILKTFYQYEPRTFEFFRDKSYYPNEKIFNRKVSEMSLDRVIEEGRTGGQVYDTPTPGFVKLTDSKGKEVWASPAIAQRVTDPAEIFIDNHRLKQRLFELRESGKKIRGAGPSNDIDTSIFTKREMIDPTFRELLGEYKDPRDLAAYGMARLLPALKGAQNIDAISKTIYENGMRAWYSDADFRAAVRNAKGDPDILATLNGYIDAKDSLAHGKLAGGKLDRFAYDRLQDFTSPYGILENAIIRKITQAINEIKIGQTVLNPITHIRNAISQPVFLLIAEANPKHYEQALDILKGKDAESKRMFRELVRLNVINPGQIVGDFNRSIGDILADKSDNVVLRGYQKLKEIGGNWYQKPDQFTRVAAFLSAMERHGGDVKKSLKFLEERTMNYDAVPPLIVMGRQVPLVNMYISFAYETLRIGKNLAKDVVRPDASWSTRAKALATLGTIVYAPELMQQAAEARLSEEDKKAWDSAKELSLPYSRNRYKMPLERLKDGSFSFVDYSPIIPQDSYAQMVKAFWKKDLAALAAVNPFVGLDNNPLLNLISEQITSRELRTGKELNTPLERVFSAAEKVLPPWTPGIGYEWKRSFPRILGGNLGETNPKTGRTNSVAGLATRFATGVNLTSVNPDSVMKGYVLGLKKDIQDQKKYLKTTLQTPGMPEWKKEKVRIQVQQTIDEIQKDFQRKMDELNGRHTLPK